MSCGLTKGRTEPCRDNVGGIKYIYLFPFVEYDDDEIDGTKGVEITEFPSTTIYKYSVENALYSENIVNDENGINYAQNLTCTLTKQDVGTTKELNTIKDIDLRCIVEFNSGKFKMLGVYNSLRLTQYSIESGGIKSDLNGYNLTFEGLEEYSAPFIDNLNTVGFYILLETSFFMLLESGDKITLE